MGEGERVLIEFQKNWSLEDLKKSISGQLKLPAGTTYRVLLDDKQITDLVDVRDYSLVKIVIEEIQIFIKPTSGTILTLKINVEISVQELQKVIANKQGIATGGIRLIYAGRQLEEEKTIADYGMMGCETIHMSGRLMGD